MSEDFFFCLGIWERGCLHGALFTLFPDEKIFFGCFKDGYPNGLCCYEVGN
jgi:hypothetical protein